jgi:hypothetical protein
MKYTRAEPTGNSYHHSPRTTPPQSGLVHSRAVCKLPPPPQSDLYHSRAGCKLPPQRIWRTGEGGGNTICRGEGNTIFRG